MSQSMRVCDLVSIFLLLVSSSNGLNFHSDHNLQALLSLYLCDALRCLNSFAPFPLFPPPPLSLSLSLSFSYASSFLYSFLSLSLFLPLSNASICLKSLLSLSLYLSLLCLICLNSFLSLPPSPPLSLSPSLSNASICLNSLLPLFLSIYVHSCRFSVFFCQKRHS